MPASITTVLCVLGVTVAFTLSPGAGALIIIGGLLWELMTVYQGNA